MEIVTGALPSLLPKLADLLVGEYNLQKEVKGGIIFLQAELETMKTALEEISATPADKLNKVDKIWARAVRELSYDIEDKIDTVIVRCKDARLAEQHGLKKAIDRSLNWLMQPKIRRKIAVDIRNIKSRLEEVAKRRDRYKITAEVDKAVMVDPHVFARYEKKTTLVAIDGPRDELIKMMMMEGNEVSRQQEKIVSIVGFGGLGKTTLANLVYENLRAQFDCSAFVSVSQTPNMEILFNHLLYQLDRRNYANISVVIDELRKFLLEKRYFIVIDDIWDISIWKMIRCALPYNNRGCRFITTTRIMKIAEEVGGAYKMKPLSLQSSRILFYRKIFGSKGKDKCSNEELAEVSDKILTKCAGVPLAIITISSLLATKGRNKLDWYDVYNSIGRGMEDNLDMENMRKVLSLSYYNLPSHTKTCLLYIGLFPEDYEIEKRRLIWMWIEEGFIQCGKKGQSPFQIGESYFNELINRSMVQPVYDMDGMNIESCRVHDMVLDLIHSLSNEEGFFTTLNGAGHTSSPQKVRRVSLRNDNLGDGIHGATVSMQQVRSLAAFSSVIDLIPALSRLDVVRVLHLENCDISHGYNLRCIGKLVHLRYLGLRSTKIVQLPEEIGNLQFLQVLDTSGNRIPTLPFTIVQLRQLKCLYINDANINMPHRIWTAPNGIRGLTSLEELSRLRIEDSMGMSTIEELGHLTKLKALDIVYCFRERERMLVECLHKLQNIQNLSISSLARRRILNDWIGPESLRSLEVYGYWFLKLPVWINHSHVPNLSFLKIIVKELQPEDLETLGRLPALRDLHMGLAKGRSNVSRDFTISTDGSFPCLAHCKLWGHYERVVFRQGAMPRLTSLELDIYREVCSTWTGIPDLGFENLLSLQDLCVHLRYGRRNDPCEWKAMAALRNMVDIHPNHPSISTSDHSRTREKTDFGLPLATF